MMDDCKQEVLEDLEAYLDRSKAKKGRGSMFLGLLIGGLVGAGYAFLSAPRSGPQTREMLREKGIELRDKAQVVVDETRDRTQILVEETKEKAQDVTRTAKDRVNEISQRGTEVVSQQVSTLQSIVGGLREGVNSYAGRSTHDPSDHSNTLAQPMDTNRSGGEDQVRPSGESTSP